MKMFVVENKWSTLSTRGTYKIIWKENCALALLLQLKRERGTEERKKCDTQRKSYAVRGKEREGVGAINR